MPSDHYDFFSRARNPQSFSRRAAYVSRQACRLFGWPWRLAGRGRLHAGYLSVYGKWRRQPAWRFSHEQGDGADHCRRHAGGRRLARCSRRGSSFWRQHDDTTFAIARALSRSWQPGDEIVLSELDHRANVDPWLTAALDRGALVRWIKANPQTLTLELAELAGIAHSGGWIRAGIAPYNTEEEIWRLIKGVQQLMR